MNTDDTPCTDEDIWRAEEAAFLASGIFPDFQLLFAATAMTRLTPNQRRLADSLLSELTELRDAEIKAHARP
jgi:hypothetical protein